MERLLQGAVRLADRRIQSLLLATAVIGCRAQPLREAGFLTGAGGAQIHFEVAGAGHDTVVVVHGGPGAGIDDIRPDLGPLMRNHVVIFYDQRGGGRSELPRDTTRLTPEYFVGDLEAVRERFHLQQLTLLAHSFGALLVASYARVHPDRVGRIVLLAATGPSREAAARFYQASPITSDTAAVRLRLPVLRSLLEGTASDPVAACQRYEALNKRIAVGAGEFADWKGTTCSMPAAAVRYYYRYTAQIAPAAFGDWDFTNSLRDLDAPLLVIDGVRDTSGLPMERAWARAVPHGRVLIVPGAGRVAYAERPDVVFSAIDEFLLGRWPAGAAPPP